MAPELRAMRESLGDRSGAALAYALEAETLHSARQREKSMALALEAVREFEDMADDPNVVRLMAAVGSAAAFIREYELAREWTDRALAAAERLGLPEVASRMLLVKGAIAQFHGRLWESIALTEGGRRVAEQHALTDLEQRIKSALANLLALDDPAAAVRVAREIVDHARRSGRREREIVTLGNMAEDARRTGEWDWIIAELEQALRDEDRSLSDLLLDSALGEFRIFRGEIGKAEVAALHERLVLLEDPDVATSANSLDGAVSLVQRDFSRAAASWMTYADGSALNAPYALPRAGHAAVLAGDADLAERVVDRLRALGVRGRAIEADVAGIRAGIAGLRGDREASLAGYRDVRGRFTDLGLAWDTAVIALPAAIALGTAEPEVLGWLADGRATFERLRARPMVDLIDVVAGSVASNRDETNGSAIAARARTQAEASSSST
jgi:tetratricopeptide (TPR) repeat protein